MKTGMTAGHLHSDKSVEYHPKQYSNAITDHPVRAYSMMNRLNLPPKCKSLD